MLQWYKNGQGSIVLRVKFLDSSVTTGAGLTGLTSSSAGLIISTIADNEATATAYTQAGSTIESITTLGTYAAPTATKCRFKEVDSTNHKGVYEIQIADARFAVSSAKSLLISWAGATNLAQGDVVIPLTSVDPYDGVHGGMSAIPNTACTTNGSLLTSGTGTAQIDTDGSGRVNLGKALGTAVTLDSNNVLNVSTKYLAGTALTGRDIGASVLLSAGTGTGQLDFTSGVVKANATQWLGGTIPAVNVTGVPLVDCKYLLGTIFSTPATAGIMDVNAKNWGNSVVTGMPMPTYTQPTGFLAATFPSGTIANTTNITAATGIDVTKFAGTTFTDTSGRVAAGFSTFFNIASPTSTMNLITAVTTVTTVTNQLTAAAIATGVWTDTTAGDFTVALSIGKSIMNGVTLGTGLTINAYTGNTVQTGDSYARIGAAGVGLTNLGDTRIANLDAAVSSRMATYTQPTGFLAATFPSGTIANTTNITAGTITTVTTVTNAVTLSAGDSPVLQSGTATAGAASTITIQTAIGANSRPVGCTIKITSGTGSGQARVITGYVDSTKVVTVDRPWATNPNNTSVYSILYTEGPALSSTLQVSGVATVDNVTTVTGNVNGNVTGSVGGISGVTFPTNFSSLAIFVTGQVGIDWGNIANPTASVILTQTLINAVEDVTQVDNPVTISGFQPDNALTLGGSVTIISATENSITFTVNSGDGVVHCSQGHFIVIEDQTAAGIIYTAKVRSVDNQGTNTPTINIYGTWPVTPLGDGHWVFLSSFIDTILISARGISV